MIRVEQKFTCQHEKPRPPVVVKTMGHSAELEDRYCFCTGQPIQMKREVRSWEPQSEALPQ